MSNAMTYIRRPFWLISIALGFLALVAFAGFALSAGNSITVWRISAGLLTILAGLSTIYNLAAQQVERVHDRLMVSLMVNPAGTIICAGVTLICLDAHRYWIVAAISSAGILLCMAVGFVLLIRYRFFVA